MVQANGDGGSGSNNNRMRSLSQVGPETTQRHRELLLSGASRYDIRDKLCEMAQHYIDLTDKKDADRSVIQEDQLNLQTWKMPYEHATYNPAPPFILNLPELNVYVTKSFVPNLTVEQFNKYREDTKRVLKGSSRDKLVDLSVTVVGNAEADFPTLCTKITLPFMFARRAMVNTYYSKQVASSNSIIAVNSSIMNEELLSEAMTEIQGGTRKMGRAIITDEVIAFNHINYVQVQPARERGGRRGCQWTSVYCLDVGGMVPDEFKRQWNDAQLKQGEAMINYVQSEANKL